MSSSFPFNFSCNYFDPFDLSANDYQVIADEMFISPVCYDSRERLAIFATLLIMFFLLGVVGFGLFCKVTSFEEIRSKNFIIRACVALHPWLRAITFVLSIFAPGSLARYIFYGLPLTCSTVAFSLIVFQWFELILRLRVFENVISSANEAIQKLKSSLLLFWILFNLTIHVFWISAWIVLNYGYSYRLQNILMGTGFACQGALSICFSAIVFSAGLQFVSILNKGDLENIEIEKISTKIKNFSRMMAFIGANCGFGSFVAAIWMGVTYSLPQGMVGFRYLLIFFVCAEFLISFTFWYLLVRSNHFSQSSAKASSKTDPEASSKNFSLTPKAVENFILEQERS